MELRHVAYLLYLSRHTVRALYLLLQSYNYKDAISAFNSLSFGCSYDFPFIIIIIIILRR